jgi:hypothetical protein
MVKGAAMSQSDIAKTLDKSKADQAKTLAGKGDSLTNAQGKMIKTQQEINEKLERDVFKGIPNAQANMARLAKATDTLANGFTTLTNGINRLLKLVGLGEKEPEKPKEMTTASAEAAKATAKEYNWGAITLAHDPNGRATKGWMPTGVPTTYVVNPSGTLVLVEAGERVWSHPAMLQKLERALDSTD